MRALLIALQASCALSAPAAGDAISPVRERELHNMVLQDCGSCHGLTMRGGLGKPLLPRDLSAFPDEIIAEIILDGVEDTPMPPWRSLVTEDEALWIARMLKTGLRQ